MRGALAPLEEMAHRAEQITSESLHARLPLPAVNDELSHLAGVFSTICWGGWNNRSISSGGSPPTLRTN